MSSETIIDMETDGLLDNVSKVHVVSHSNDPEGDPTSTHDPQDMIDLLHEDRQFVCHNIIGYDREVWHKLLGVYVPNENCIDTLMLSRYLEFTRGSHGLESYGVENGIPKPKVDDWENLSDQEYAHRCEQDVLNNSKVWYKTLRPKLMELYG